MTTSHSPPALICPPFTHLVSPAECDKLSLWLRIDGTPVICSLSFQQGRNIPVAQ